MRAGEQRACGEMSLIPIEEEVISQSRFDLEGIVTDHGGDFVRGASRGIHDVLGTDCLHGDGVTLDGVPGARSASEHILHCHLLSSVPLGLGNLLGQLRKGNLVGGGLGRPTEEVVGGHNSRDQQGQHRIEGLLGGLGAYVGIQDHIDSHPHGHGGRKANAVKGHLLDGRARFQRRTGLMSVQIFLGFPVPHVQLELLRSVILKAGDGSNLPSYAHLDTVVHGILGQSYRELVRYDIPRVRCQQCPDRLRMDRGLQFLQFLLIDDAEAFHAVGLPLLEQSVQHLHLILVERQHQTPVPLIPESQFSIQPRKHLIAPPAILGPHGSGRIVVSRVNDPRIPLRGALTDVVGRLDQ
mmetsp:Transcript_54627/g.163241  ORF Transcript_54627/g.163241 Transcript_54627/m.163241 type:complete len:353 (+) Transcript_54627:1197-2255(+)